MIRKKICFVVTIGVTFKAFLFELSRYLIDSQNYDVTVICDEDDSMKELTSNHLHYIPVKMKRGWALDGCEAIRKMYKIFKKERFDIIQYSTSNAATYASIASFLAGNKCRLYCQWGFVFTSFKGLKRLLLLLDEKLICKLSSVIEVESHSLYEASLKYKMYNRKKASIIWNGSACGVNLSKYPLSNKREWRKEIRAKFGIPDDGFVFGYCGRITRDKGINELISAFKEVVNVRSVYLMIIGSFDNAETIDPKLLAWAQECPNVFFTGRTDRVPVYYSALDVFVSLSYREGFGLVVIEAAAMGIPGIASDAIGQRDTIREKTTGLQVKTKNVQSVVDAMLYCVDNKDKVIEMGANARKNVEESYDQSTLFDMLADHRNKLIVHK